MPTEVINVTVCGESDSKENGASKSQEMRRPRSLPKFVTKSQPSGKSGKSRRPKKQQKKLRDFEKDNFGVPIIEDVAAELEQSGVFDICSDDDDEKDDWCMDFLVDNYSKRGD